MNKWHKIKNTFASFVNYKKGKCEEWTYDKGDYQFYPLSPSKNIEISGYKEAMDTALSTDSIKNIAITGVYGSGKSSMMLSYEKYNKRDTFMHIELPHFKTDTVSNETISDQSEENIILKNDENEHTNKESNNPVFIKNIEEKIINQLLNQISSDKIPQSIFPKKIEKKFTKDLTISMVICTFLTTLFLLLNQIENWIPQFFHIKTNMIGFFVSNLEDIIFLISMGYLIYRLVKVAGTQWKLKNVQISGLTVDLDKGIPDDRSYFDNYINDVLYLFKNADANVFVFEDLDRYEIPVIYERLHEINILLNKNKNSNFKFIYMLKDDNFSSVDRSKIFDMIIPVISVMSSVNSFDALKSEFTEDKLLRKLEEPFLRKISLYIDDMRLMKNIFNEYKIYHKRLGVHKSANLKDDKLFAIITYKNIFPKDFSNLQSETSLLNAIIDDYYEYLSRKDNEINARIDDLDSKIKDISKEINEENSEELSNLLLDLNQEYKNKTSVKAQSLKSYVSTKNPDYFIEKASQSNSTYMVKERYFGIVAFVLTQGLVDERYKDYINYYYPGALSANDKAFLRNSLEMNKPDFTIKIDDAGALLSNIEKFDFSKYQIKNIDLYIFMIEDTKGFMSKIDDAMTMLKSTRDFKFIIELNRTLKGKNLRHEQELLRLLIKDWSNMLVDLVNVEVEFERNKVVELILDEINLEISRDSVSVEVINYINAYAVSVISLIKANNYEKIFSKLLYYKVSFSSVNGILLESLKNMMDNNVVKLNYDLLLRLIKEIGNEDTSKIISTIKESGDETFINFYKNNQMEILLLYINKTEKINDNELIDEINLLAFDSTTLSDLLRKWTNKVDDIKKISSTSKWNLILENESVTDSSRNIQLLFENNGKKLSKNIISIINIKKDDLTFSDLLDEQKQSFFAELVVDSEIICGQYISVLKSLNRIYNQSYPREIPDSRIVALIKNDIITMTKQNVQQTLSVTPDKVFAYANKDVNKFKEIIIELKVNDSVIEKIIINEETKTDVRVALIEYHHKPIDLSKIYEDQDAVAKSLEFSLMSGNVDFGLDKFNYFDDRNQDVLIKELARYETELENKLKDSWNENLVWKLILGNTDISFRRNIFVSFFEKFNLEAFKKCVVVLGYSNKFIDVLHRKRMKIEFSHENKKLAEAMKRRDWLTKVAEKDSMLFVQGRNIDR